MYIYIYISNGSFRNNENVQKKDGGSDRFVSNNQFSSMTLNKLVLAKLSIQRLINPNADRIANNCLEYMSLNL